MSECITCTYYGKHLEGDGDKLPWPCVECHYGERYVKKGERKPPAPIKAELAALREQVKVLREALEDGRDDLGMWLSVALEDPKTCISFKTCIQVWMDGTFAALEQTKPEEGE